MSFHLFEAYGVELEYMIVDREGLQVRPIADHVLVEDGEIVQSHEDGPVTWSNELALHVIELKGTEPMRELEGCGALFQESLGRILQRLEKDDAILLPSGMHPLMDPDREFRRWPHEDAEIYEAFDRIFDCRGHGWSNLQSAHLNLPFSGDDEFGRLHAAIRAILPILPALCASSPIYGGERRPELDARLEVYSHNAKSVPEVSGSVIPEAVFTAADYDAEIFQPMYRAIARFEGSEALQYEWLNARGAIARFDRDTIEIRVMDVQEHPAADLAIIAGVSRVLQSLCEPQKSSPLRALETSALKQIFDRCVSKAESAVIDDRRYLELLGFPGKQSARASELWWHLLESTGALDNASDHPHLELILNEGTLASRLVRALPETPEKTEIVEVYRRLAACLETGQGFRP